MAIGEFRAAWSLPNQTQVGVANMHKALGLHYMGLEGLDEDELASCAAHFESVTQEAWARGWDLEVPDLSRQKVI